MKNILLITVILFISGCKGENMQKNALNKNVFSDISQQQFNKLESEKVYFGHQSVGYNIIEGIKDVIQKNKNFKLYIKETKNSTDFGHPIFAHSSIGRNKDPISKIDDFKKIMESGVGDKVDIALFKLCFVDIDKETDIDKVFKKYAETIFVLESNYSKVTFLHCTVPLRSVSTGVKARIKRILGFTSEEEEGNIKRNLFNRMLLEKYGGRVFDLAKCESTYMDGKRSQFKKNNNSFDCLVPEYTDDTGHLNKIGREVVAEKLLFFLIFA